MNLKKFDYIIVGQGLAGTLLDYSLQDRGRSVGVIDDGYPRSASRVAAGLINPVTGRRYVKSWRIDDLLPVAQKTYRTLEKELGISIFRKLNILRSLFNQGDENNWWARSGESGYEKYLLDKVELGNYAQFTSPGIAHGEVQNGAQINLVKLIEAYRRKLEREQRFQQSVFDYRQLEINENNVEYGDWKADNLIFCEGAKVKQNPFFNDLPFRGDKGEALIVRIPGAHFSKALKRRIFIIPLGDELYWIGATYERRHKNDLPTEKGRIFLEEHLKSFLKAPFEILEHRAAIRPTVKDRRPFLGRHARYPQLVLFNGLGTKGASLAPFWAKHMAAYLSDEQELDPAVDIRRFS